MLAGKNNQILNIVKLLKSKDGDYLFMGLPAAGKTVYFGSLVNHLQDVGNRTSSRFKVKIQDNHTEKMISEVMEKLKSQKWPDKTQNKSDEKFSVKLKVGWQLLKQTVVTISYNLIYNDYPGEVFVTAFTEQNNSPNERYKQQAESLLEQLNKAKGVFLLFDVESMYNGTDEDIFKGSVTGLFKYISKHNPSVPTAIIFSKTELLKNIKESKNVNLQSLFRRNYGRAYSFLPAKHKFFELYVLGDYDVDEDGQIIPPEKLMPRNLLDPVDWMIGL